MKKQIADHANISGNWLSKIINSGAKASAKTTKALVAATGIPAEIWQSRDAGIINAAIDDYLSSQFSLSAPPQSTAPAKIRTLKQLAASCGISKEHLSRIINEKTAPSWPLAKKLAAATDTRPELWADRKIDQLWPALELYQYGRYINYEYEGDYDR